MTRTTTPVCQAFLLSEDNKRNLFEILAGVAAEDNGDHEPITFQLEENDGRHYLWAHIPPGHDWERWTVTVAMKYTLQPVEL
jgi:hypothetical protein